MSDLFTFAEQQARAGMKRAADHADAKAPGWGDKAYAWIKKYAATHHQFISEECTDAAALAGIVSPADARAWGAPFKRAARDGLIVRVGYGVSKRRNLSPTPLWESQVCGAR